MWAIRRKRYLLFFFFSSASACNASEAGRGKKIDLAMTSSYVKKPRKNKRKKTLHSGS